MHMHHDHHAHRDPDAVEEPFDAANQSLSDALRASFKVLKGIMVVLGVLFLFSNVKRVESHEQALILRLGRLLPKVHDAGLVWAFPFPIDEIVPLPTRKSNELIVDSHTFYREENEKGKPLSFISRGPHRGLDPSRDGALLTADSGLVHVQWKITYKITDVRSYVSNLVGLEIEAAEDLIRTLVETVGIEVASQLTAEEFIRTRVDEVQRMMKGRINGRLAALNGDPQNPLASGIAVTFVELFEPTPPMQVRDSFDSAQKAENTKAQMRRAAEQEAAKILSGAAGAVHQEVVAVLDVIDLGGTEAMPLQEAQDELERLLMERVEGQAGQMIKVASAFRSRVIGKIQDDLTMYRGLLPEYERNPTLLIERLWEETRETIFTSLGVIKIYRPALSEFRLHLPLDPEQTRVDEEIRLQKKDFDPSTLRQETLHPIGPEYD